MQLQHIAQIFTGQVLGDDLAARPNPTQRCRSASDDGGHLPKTTRHSATCPEALVLLPRSPAGSPVAHHVRCWLNQSSSSCHACWAASALYRGLVSLKKAWPAPAKVRISWVSPAALRAASARSRVAFTRSSCSPYIA